MKRVFIISLVGAVSLLSCYSQSWTKADSLRMKFYNQGRYDSGLYYAGEAAALMRGSIGENSIQYASMLRKLAESHFSVGNYRKAEYFILSEAALRESLKKADDQEYITCLETASVICRKAGNYEKAYEQIKKADLKALDIFDREGPLYAEVLNNYAGVYHDMGFTINDMLYIRQEEKYLKRAEAIYLKYGERKRNEYIINQSDQSSWNNNIGNSPLAESLALGVMKLCKTAYGDDSPGYASAINNLAVLYFNTGNFKLAEKNFVAAIDLFKKSPVAGKTETAICMNNLAALYHSIGNYKVAAKLLDEAMILMEGDSRKESPEFAVLLNNLGSVSLSEDYYASQENKNRQRLMNSGRLLMKADSVFRMNCQKPHPYSQAITGNLAFWYNAIGDKKKSARMMEDFVAESSMNLRVVSMMSKMGISGYLPSDNKAIRGPQPDMIPISIKMYEEMAAANMQGGSGESDAMVRGIMKLVMGKANNIKKAVGPYHPAYATMLKSLIAVYGSVDDVKTEEELTLEYMNVINHKTLQDFSFLSESEKEMYYQMRLPDMYSFTSYSIIRKKANPLITGYTYNNILLNKGLMLKSSTAMRLAILNSNNQALLAQYDEWIALQKQISVLYATPVEMRTQDVSVLESKANTLEKSLVASSQDFSDYRKGLQVTWEDVRKNLKPDEAAIEFTDFKRKERDGGDAVIYCALIVRSGSRYPEMIRLFNEEQLKSIIEKSSTGSISDINGIYGSAGKQDERLYDLIWKPMEAYLNGVKNVYISPTGLLYKISFPAISNGKDVYLCDKYQIQEKGSTGNITTQSLFTGDSRPSALVLGGIQYGSNNDSEVWSYLKGTKDEGDAVENILKKGQVDVQYLNGSNATETFFKTSAPKYNILHIATHGFFFADPNEVRFEEKKNEVEYGQVTFRGAARGFGVSSFVNNENPLMRSGLVLAGANDVWVKTEKGDTDDGVLTAQEVTQCDLRRNDLVVLSACETGLGDIKGNEGVYGLQRALKMAGVKYIIMSLWQIPDKETVEFMGLFYNYLLADKDIKAAFYRAQKEMRSRYDPYFWGAFVLME